LEKYRTLAQHQLAIRQSRFLGFAVTEMLNRFLSTNGTSRGVLTASIGMPE
jgi:hypothetical protein